MFKSITIKLFTAITLIHSINSTLSSTYETILSTPNTKEQAELYNTLKHHHSHFITNTIALPNSIKTNKEKVSFGDNLTISFPYYDKTLIALHCPANEINPENFRHVMSAKQLMQSPSVTIEQLHEFPILHWNISFPILREDSCNFQLWEKNIHKMQFNQKTFELKATSDIIQVINGKSKPTGIHLSYTSSPNEMNIQFTTGGVMEDIIPVVRYRIKHQKDNRIVHGTSTTYTASDMCNEPANITAPDKFIHPGLLHSIILQNLVLDTEYVYKVGTVRSSKHIVWSDEYTFTSALNHAPHFSFVVYGDQGTNHNSKKISRMIQKEVHAHTIAAVHHIGDLSYAEGSGYVWDAWFDIIQKSFSTRLPLMVTVGNHEYDYSGESSANDPSSIDTDGMYDPNWGNYGNDSGGECGVPFSKRFTMPNSTLSNGNFWYSYNYANVHFISISSEHNISKDSLQYNWLKNDLMNTKSSWIIVQCHRPIYNSNKKGTQEHRVAAAIRQSIEDLLYEYNVDLFLAGHYHSYLRTCNKLYKSKCNNDKGTMYISVGTAGAGLNHGGYYYEDWVDVSLHEHGFGKLKVFNDTALRWEFIVEKEDDDGGYKEVKDVVWIWK